MRRARGLVALVVLAVLLGGIESSPPDRLAGSASSRAATPLVADVGSAAAIDRLVLASPVTRGEILDLAPTAPPPGDLAIAPPPEVFDEPPAPPEPPPRQLAAFDGTELEGGTWAVVVGINDYPGTRADLKSAVNDANDMERALTLAGVPAERRLVLRDGQASGQVLRQAADWLVAHAGPDATAVFFFAGHVRKLSSRTEALVGADGDVVSDTELSTLLGDLTAERAWIVVAGCFGGGFTEVVEPGRILTAAADAHSLAYENSAFGRSYLAEYLVRRTLIEGAARRPTVQDAYARAHAALRRDYPNRLPFQLDQSTGPVRFAMGADPSGAPAPTAPDRPSTAPEPDRSPDKDPVSPPPEEDEDDGACAGLRLGVVTCG